MVGAAAATGDGDILMRFVPRCVSLLHPTPESRVAMPCVRIEHNRLCHVTQTCVWQNFLETLPTSSSHYHFNSHNHSDEAVIVL